LATSCGALGEQLFYWAYAVAVPFGGNPKAVEQGEPDVAQGSAFGQYEVLAETDPCSAACE
jgi:hypothetical protein